MRKRVEQEQDNAWPPAPTPSTSKISALPQALLGSPSEVLPGLLLGFVLFVAIAVVGGLLILVVGTILFGPSKPGQTVYKPILPFPVFKMLFILCHSPAIYIFSRLRRQKAYFAYGVLVGSPLGMTFLIWLWECVMPGVFNWGYSS